MEPNREAKAARGRKLFGFYSAILSAAFYLLFDVAAVAGMSGSIKDPFVVSLAWYGPSLLLTYSYLGMVAALYQDELCQNRLYILCALAVGLIYVTLNSMTYVIQVALIAPSFLNYTFANVSVFEMASGKPLYAVNGLAYTLMGFSTLFLSLSMRRRSSGNAMKTVLFLHGVVAPSVFCALFLNEAFFVSSTIAITYPASAFLIARYFWKSRKES